MKKFRYLGFLLLQEQNADNTELWRRCVEDVDYARRMDISPEAAQAHLEFSRRFPPGQPHDRLVAHRVEIFQYQEVQWQKGKAMYLPAGEKGLVARGDLGEELLLLLGKQPFREEVLEEHVVQPLPDGTEIQGRRIRKIPITSEPLDQFRNYLRLEFDLSRHNYAFHVDMQKMNEAHPFETVVKRYVTVNGQAVGEEEREIVVPVLRIRKHGLETVRGPWGQRKLGVVYRRK